MHYMKAVASVTPLPGSEGLRMVPIGARLIMFFGETIAVGVSEENSYYEYNYKTEFQI